MAGASKCSCFKSSQLRFAELLRVSPAFVRKPIAAVLETGILHGRPSRPSFPTALKGLTAQRMLHETTLKAFRKKEEHQATLDRDCFNVSTLNSKLSNCAKLMAAYEGSEEEKRSCCAYYWPWHSSTRRVGK